MLKQGTGIVVFIDEGHSVIRLYKYQGRLLKVKPTCAEVYICINCQADTKLAIIITHPLLHMSANMVFYHAT